MPQRITDLLRELHRRSRNPSQEAAPHFDPDERTAREAALASKHSGKPLRRT
jgi:hypothetical protein